MLRPQGLLINRQRALKEWRSAGIVAPPVDDGRKADARRAYSTEVIQLVCDGQRLLGEVRCLGFPAALLLDAGQLAETTNRLIAHPEVPEEHERLAQEAKRTLGLARTDRLKARNPECSGAQLLVDRSAVACQR